MEKFVMAIRIAPKTREKLELIKDCTGLSFGVVIDNLVKDAEMEKYCETPIETTDGQD